MAGSIGRRAGSALYEFLNRASDPGATLTRIKLYCKAVSGVSQLFAQLSDGTVVQITPGLGSRQAVPEVWAQNAVAISQTNAALFCGVSQLFDNWPAFRAGSIVGLRTRFDTPVTAGTLTAKVSVNGGTSGTLNVVSTSSSNSSGGLSTQAAGGDAFVAGDLLSVLLTTDGTFAPVTLNMEAELEIYVNNV